MSHQISHILHLFWVFRKTKMEIKPEITLCFLTEQSFFEDEPSHVKMGQKSGFEFFSSPFFV